MPQLGLASFGLLAQAAPQVADAAARVGVGRIVGGWEYVYSGYGIAYAAMAGYAVYLWVRGRRTEDSSRDGRLPPPNP